MRWLRSLWMYAVGRYYERLRKIDIEILWPSCVAQTQDLDHAKAVFAVHAFRDRAWACLGSDEIIRRIEDLRLPGR